MNHPALTANGLQKQKYNFCRHAGSRRSPLMDEARVRMVATNDFQDSLPEVKWRKETNGQPGKPRRYR